MNVERELLLHKQISVLHQQRAGNRAKRNKVSFQEGSGLNTRFHRAGQGAEQLVPTDFFLFIQMLKLVKILSSPSAASNETLLCSASWKDYHMPTLNMSESNPFLWTRRGEKPNESSIVICVDGFC